MTGNEKPYYLNEDGNIMMRGSQRPNGTIRKDRRINATHGFYTHFERQAYIPPQRRTNNQEVQQRMELNRKWISNGVMKKKSELLALLNGELPEATGEKDDTTENKSQVEQNSEISVQEKDDEVDENIKVKTEHEEISRQTSTQESEIADKTRDNSGHLKPPVQDRDKPITEVDNCICQRPKMLVYCAYCYHWGRSRIFEDCKAHPKDFSNVDDWKSCPKCLASQSFLRETGWADILGSSGPMSKKELKYVAKSKADEFMLDAQGILLLCSFCGFYKINGQAKAFKKCPDCTEEDFLKDMALVYL